MNDTYHILTIAGSLRENSSTAHVLRAAENLGQGILHFTRYRGLASLPAFDDHEEIPASVADFKQQIQAADAVLICTPEYAFGVPGALKNALDWTISSGEFVNKPVGLITAATRGESAHASLLLTLSAISAIVPEGASLLVPFIRSKIDADGNILDWETRRGLSTVIENLVRALQE